MIKKIFKENYILISIFILFVLLALIIKNTDIMKSILNIDYFMIEKLNYLVSESNTFLFLVFTMIGDFYIPIIIILSFLVFFKNKIYFLFLSISYAFSGLITFLLKILISRPRPIYSLIETPDKYSFPSGHTLTSVVFYIMLSYVICYKIKNKIIKTSFIIGISILVMLIAFSRVYLGVHYLSDVLGGVIFGILLVVLNINIIRKNFKEYLK